MAEMSHGLFTSTLTHTEHLKNVHFLATGPLGSPWTSSFFNVAISPGGNLSGSLASSPEVTSEGLRFPTALGSGALKGKSVKTFLF